MIEVQYLSNAVRRVIPTQSTKSTNYLGTGLTDATLPMAVMSYIMARSGYDRSQIVDELGIGEKGMLGVDEYLFKEIHKEKSDIHLKIKLVKNYLRLNHSMLID